MYFIVIMLQKQNKTSYYSTILLEDSCKTLESNLKIVV